MKSGPEQDTEPSQRLPLQLNVLKRMDPWRAETKVHTVDVRNSTSRFSSLCSRCLLNITIKRSNLFFIKQEINTSVYQRTNECRRGSWQALTTHGTRRPDSSRTWPGTSAAGFWVPGACPRLPLFTSCTAHPAFAKGKMDATPQIIHKTRS